MMPPGACVAIRDGLDVPPARAAARTLLQALRFDRLAEAAVLLAVTELATNLVRYGQGGALHLQAVTTERGAGVEVLSRDHGPGIADPRRALEDGYSTGGGLGSGLPGVRRLMDSFVLTTSPQGTTIVVCKWPTGR